MATLWSWAILLVLHIGGWGQVPVLRVTSFWALTMMFLTAFRSGARAAARRQPWYRQEALVIGPADQTTATMRKIERHPEWRAARAARDGGHAAPDAPAGPPGSLGASSSGPWTSWPARSRCGAGARPGRVRGRYQAPLAGPVFFRQRRVGRGNEPFELLKFRSMCVGADAPKQEVARLNLHGGGTETGMFKIRADPRITRVGGFMRRYSLDELPQLFNIVRGEMSFVGPRPLIENEDRQVGGRFPRRLGIPPRLTGLWQVHGRSEYRSARW